MIKISKICKEFGICRQTLYNWNKIGKISLIKTIGGHYFVSEDTYFYLSLILKNNNHE